MSMGSASAATPLQKNLVGDLVGIVATGQADEQLAVLQAEIPDLPVGMAGPADRQQHRSHLGPGHVRLKLFNGFMLPGRNPNQFLQPESRFEGLVGVWPTFATDDDQTLVLQKLGDLLHFLRKPPW